jgi:hypothetical protein
MPTLAMVALEDITLALQWFGQIPAHDFLTEYQAFMAESRHK